MTMKPVILYLREFGVLERSIQVEQHNLQELKLSEPGKPSPERGFDFDALYSHPNASSTN